MSGTRNEHDKQPKRTVRRQAAGANPTTSLTYYIVVSLAVLAGFMAYGSGATLEGALVRAIVALIVGTAVGYGVNLLLWVAIRPPARQSQDALGRHVDLVADDGVPAK